MSKFFALIAAGLVSAALAAPASAHEAHDGGYRGHDSHDEYHHHDGFRGGVFLVDPLYPYPYGVAGVYSYPYAAGYGYFCPAANAFYPAVASCPVAWQLLPLQ
jgi:hypothetical protein